MNTIEYKPKPCPVCTELASYITSLVNGITETRLACSRCGYQVQRDCGEQK